MNVLEPVEIRLLGSLRVRRSDNSAVKASEWRTGKTIDLLRLLACNVDQPVRIEWLLDTLWPDVEESKGRASLRTAASQIRRTLRSDCIERRMGGLVLTDAWVDVTAFQDLAVEARSCHRAGEHAKVVSLARQAEALYLGDFAAQDSGGDWALEWRDSMRAMRVAMLTEALESAVELRWLRDAIVLAHSVIDADPYCDRGHRGLMSAYAGLGETDRALRVYADFRTLLDRDLGVLPSAQTQAMQMSLLTGTHEAAGVRCWVGHEDDRTAVASLITRPAGDSVRVLCVSGAPGSDREGLIDAAVHQTGVDAVHLHPQSSAPLPSSTQIGAAARQAHVAVLPPLDSCDDTDIAELVSTLAQLSPGNDVTFVVPVDGSHLEALLMESEMVRLKVDLVELHAMTREEIERLAGEVLCGPPTPGLVETLMRGSGGLSGIAADELHRWLAEGRVLWTPSGLDLSCASDEAPQPEIESIVRRVLDRACPLGVDVLSLLALINRPTTATLVLHLLDRSAWPDVTEEEVELSLDLLTDMGALALGPRGYEFAHEQMRRTTEAWLRHGVRRRLHRRLAESPLLPDGDRADHWIKAAAPVRAALAEVAAARVAHDNGDGDESLRHLSVSRDYARLATTSAEQMRALHLVSEMASEIGAVGIARAADATVVDVALGQTLPSPDLSVRPEADVDLPAWARLLETAVHRALGALLLDTRLTVTLSVLPDAPRETPEGLHRDATVDVTVCDRPGMELVPEPRSA